MKNKKTEYFPITALREDLRSKAGEHAARLGRSVARLTSCDMKPCMEYGEEIMSEHAIVEKMFYMQYCRNALERCINSGSAILRYNWSDGSTTTTRFSRIGPNRVKVTGLVKCG